MEGAMVQSKLAPRCFLLGSFSATPTKAGTAQGTQVLADTHEASCAELITTLFNKCSVAGQKLPTEGSRPQICTEAANATEKKKKHSHRLLMLLMNPRSVLATHNTAVTGEPEAK